MEALNLVPSSGYGDAEIAQMLMVGESTVHRTRQCLKFLKWLHNCLLTDRSIRSQKVFATQLRNVDDIVYDLEAKTYNDLIAMQTNSAIPCILILLTLPQEQERWLECSSTRVTIGGGCYWYYPSGLPTTNKQSQRISIPRQQLLTPESVITLLNKVKTGNL